MIMNGNLDWSQLVNMFLLLSLPTQFYYLDEHSLFGILVRQSSDY